MRDITAIVLTIGEETTKKAVDSLKNQTVLPQEIILISNVTPFHKALNLGASRVKTEFFVQVDSDMILDENCLEELRKYMMENVGITIGPLIDPLMGIESGVKMFRKKCFEKIQFRNSISPDTDFYKDIEKYGWRRISVLNWRYRGQSNRLWHTFGEHRPVYTPVYAYQRYHLIGRRYRYRRDLKGLNWRFRELQRNKHSLSLFAEIAMAHGIFSLEKKDLLEPSLYSNNEDFDFLENFLKSESNYEIEEPDILSLLTLRPKAIFKKFYNLGVNIRKNNSYPALKYCMDILGKSHGNVAWIAKVGLYHGIFSETYNGEKAGKEYEMLNELL